MTHPPDKPNNRLLRALPAADLRRLQPLLKPAQFKREQVLVDADGPLDEIYFPDRGVISIVAVYPDGSIIEMATIGREGCTGLQAVLGSDRSSMRLYVQLAGSGVRMSRRNFARAMTGMPAFRALMYAYLHAFLEQVMVSAACNGAHNLKQRLARWLLMMRDRHDADALPLTHSLLAEMLGVQRPTIRCGRAQPTICPIRTPETALRPLGNLYYRRSTQAAIACGAFRAIRRAL